MAKRIEETKYIKVDDILAYPLRRATCDKGNADRIVREDFFCADGAKREEAKRNEKGD